MGLRLVLRLRGLGFLNVSLAFGDIRSFFLLSKRLTWGSNLRLFRQDFALGVSRASRSRGRPSAASKDTSKEPHQLTCSFSDMLSGDKYALN